MKIHKTIAGSILFSFLCIQLLWAQAVPTDQKDIHPQPGMEMKEAEILAFFVAINEHEVTAANEAIQKKGNQQIAQYAEMMKKDHSKNLTDTKKIAQDLKVELATTPDVEQLKAQNVSDRAELAKLSGKAFDDTYIDQMVRDHSKVLEMIDTKFISATSNSQLQEYLKNTRTDVSGHLDEAKRIQKEIR